PRWRAHRVHAVQRESQRTQGPPARGQCGRAWTAEGCGSCGADGATCGDFRAGGRTRADRARAGCGSGAVEWRSAGSDELGGPGVDRGASGGDAVTADRVARALSQALAMIVGLWPGSQIFSAFIPDTNTDRDMSPVCPIPDISTSDSNASAFPALRHSSSTSCRSDTLCAICITPISRVPAITTTRFPFGPANVEKYP